MSVASMWDLLETETITSLTPTTRQRLVSMALVGNPGERRRYFEALDELPGKTLTKEEHDFVSRCRSHFEYLNSGNNHHRTGLSYHNEEDDNLTEHSRAFDNHDGSIATALTDYSVDDGPNMQLRHASQLLGMFENDKRELQQKHAQGTPYKAARRSGRGGQNRHPPPPIPEQPFSPSNVSDIMSLPAHDIGAFPSSPIPSRAARNTRETPTRPPTARAQTQPHTAPVSFPQSATQRRRALLDEQIKTRSEYEKCAKHLVELDVKLRKIADDLREANVGGAAEGLED